MIKVDDRKPEKPVPANICTRCVGSGYILIKNGEDATDCPSCGGTGKSK